MEPRGPKCRLCRRAGLKLFLKGERCFTPKCAIVRRNYPPGVAGAKKAKPRLSSYGLHLREKQKARFLYRVSEKQFSNYFQKATRKVGNTGELMIQLLETRFDNAIFRLGWARSRDEARQFVGHGFFLVDGKKVTISSYHVRVGQIISLKPNADTKKTFQDIVPLLAKHQLPKWLHDQKGAFEAKVVSSPSAEDVGAIFDVKSIIEYYSK